MKTALSMRLSSQPFSATAEQEGSIWLDSSFRGTRWPRGGNIIYAVVEAVALISESQHRRGQLSPPCRIAAARGSSPPGTRVARRGGHPFGTQSAAAVGGRAPCRRTNCRSVTAAAVGGAWTRAAAGRPLTSVQPVRVEVSGAVPLAPTATVAAVPDPPVDHTDGRTRLP